MSSPAQPQEQTDFIGRFGAPIAEFRVSNFTLCLLLILSSGAVAVGLALGLAFLYALVSAGSVKELTLIALGGAVTSVLVYAHLRKKSRHHGTRAHLLAQLAHLLGAGVVYLYSSTSGWRRARQIRGLRVLVFPQGIARIQANAMDVICWEEITTVRRAILWEEDMDTVFAARVRFSLATVDGRAYEFDDALSGFKALRKLVEQYTLPHLLHHALDAYEAGADVWFGGLRVSRHGLAYGRHFLPWAECGAVETRKGLLHVRSLGARRPRWKIHLVEVPNVHVLIALVGYVQKYGLSPQR